MFKFETKKSGKNLGKQGFTLIEILLSMVIFSLIVGGIILFSARTMQSHMKDQAMQNAIDNARFAIETMNKKIRTSGDLTVDSYDKYETQEKKVCFTPNDEKDEICYEFSSDGTLKKGSEVLVGGTDGKITVDGHFHVKETTGTSRGMVTTVIHIQYNKNSDDPSEIDDITLQSTVSMRDYKL